MQSNARFIHVVSKQQFVDWNDLGTESDRKVDMSLSFSDFFESGGGYIVACLVPLDQINIIYKILT